MWSYWGRVLVKVLHKATLFVLQSFCGRSTSKGRGAASYWGPGGGGKASFGVSGGKTPEAAPTQRGLDGEAPGSGGQPPEWTRLIVHNHETTKQKLTNAVISSWLRPWKDRCDVLKSVVVLRSFSREIFAQSDLARFTVVLRSLHFEGGGGAVSYSGPGAMPPLGFQGAKLPRQQPRGSR